MKRKSKATILKEDIHALKSYKQQRATAVFHFALTTEQEIKARNPLAVEAEQLLSIEKLEELKYNCIKVRQEVILASNLQTECKILKLLNQKFLIGHRYAIPAIKKHLQLIYEKLNVRDKKGNILKADATDLGEVGRFHIHLCKMKDTGENGYEIIGKQFNLHVAA